MKTQQWTVRIIVAALLVPVILAVAFVASTTFAQSQNQWGLSGHNLSKLSPNEVAQVALDYTKASGYVNSGTPQVALARSVNNDELLKLDLDTIPFSTIEQPPLVLVILKGDFMVNMPRAVANNGPRPAQYIGYVYDLWAGLPTLTITAPHGGVFRKALNDPSLPDDNPAAPQKPNPGAFAPANGGVTNTPPTLHYGEVAPTAVVIEPAPSK
jgi:hypothetical protein